MPGTCCGAGVCFNYAEVFMKSKSIQKMQIISRKRQFVIRASDASMDELRQHQF